jgi:hypothetical protein
MSTAGNGLLALRSLKFALSSKASLFLWYRVPHFLWRRILQLLLLHATGTISQKKGLLPLERFALRSEVADRTYAGRLSFLYEWSRLIIEGPPFGSLIQATRCGLHYGPASCLSAERKP